MLSVGAALLPPKNERNPRLTNRKTGRARPANPVGRQHFDHFATHLKSLASSPAETRRTEVLLEQSFMSSRPSLEIIDQPIDQLRGCENSAHTHNRAQYAKVSALIKKHGPVIPLIVDPDGEVIDGFLRLQCLKDQGYKTAPTVTVRTNNPADIKTLRLALNRPIGCGRLPQ